MYDELGISIFIHVLKIQLSIVGSDRESDYNEQTTQHLHENLGPAGLSK